MIKKILYLMLACVLGLGALSLGGCKEEPKGQFYSITEAHQNGWLSREDIMHICYFSSGKVHELDAEGNWKEIDFTPKFEFIPLDKEKEGEIKTAFFIENVPESARKEYGIEEIELKYFGAYNGCYAVYLHCDRWAYVASVEFECVEGIIWSASGPRILVFRYIS